ncbi:MAG: hypothetical protein QOD69_1111 [Solirubrobacteraceae bacterium]|nr:hypothetical protein [Solirubrobacteraceae bacterium]
MFVRSVSPHVTKSAGASGPAPAPARPAPAGDAAGPAPRTGADGLDALLSRAVLQRTIAFEPGDPSAETVHKRLLERAEILPKGAAELLGGALNVGKVAEGLARLRGSAAAYGTFDLALDDALLLLFFELKKHVEKPRRAEDPATELTAVEAESRATGAFEEYAGLSPAPKATYELAFLGAGAATAYYMTSAPGLPPRSRTIVVGPKQPWAGERGPGAVNHPLHMITPRRDVVGLGDEALAPRADFSEEIEEVLGEHAGHRRETKVELVKKITHEKRQFYEITLSAGDPKVIYARKVVAALGIGPHLRGGLTKAGVEGEQDPLVDERGVSRALDLDEFQRLAPDIPRDPRPTVVISGPNAGIDAVKVALECGFEIYWVLGRGGKPALLSGTDNEIVQEEYEKRGDNRSPRIAEYVMGRTQGAVRAPAEPPPLKPILVKVDGRDIPADYYVMAAGPNVKKISGVFDEETVRKHIVATYDRNRQFDDSREDGQATVVGLEVENEAATDETALEIIGGSAYRMAIAPDLKISHDYLRRRWQEVAGAVSQMAGLTGSFMGMSAGADKEIVAAMDKLYDLASAYRFAVLGKAWSIEHAERAGDLPDLPEVPDFGPPAGPLRAAKLDKPRAEVVNGFLAMLRVLQSYGTMLALRRARVKEYLEKPAGRDPRLAGEHMTGVIRSLPTNVAFNDQLTPTRSQIEAQTGFVPGYVAKDVNFATDSATVLQVHISTKYPDLDDAEVDLWVDRIVRWRRPENADEWRDYPSLKGPLPNPLKNKSRDTATSFSDRFKRWLAEENEAARRRNVEKRRLAAVAK